MATSKKTTVSKASEEDIAVENESVKKVPKNIDLNEIITVRNGYQGKLVYKSKRTGEKYVWDFFGDEQEMELRELRNAKSSAKSFFQNNWFAFSEEFDWVIDYLGIRSFYKNALGVDNFDDIFRKSPQEIEKVISKLTAGQKRSVSYRARQLIAEGSIDSNKVISTLEKALDTELIQR